MATALWITRSDIMTLSPLDGNIDTDKLTPFIKSAQDINVQDVLGTDLFNRINDDIQNSNLTGDYLTLVQEYVRPMLVHMMVTDFLGFHSVEITNAGIFNRISTTGNNADADQVQKLIRQERNTADFYRRRLLDHLSFKARTLYPEYYTNSNGDMYPNRERWTGGWRI